MTCSLQIEHQALWHMAVCLLLRCSTVRYRFLSWSTTVPAQSGWNIVHHQRTLVDFYITIRGKRQCHDTGLRTPVQLISCYSDSSK